MTDRQEQHSTRDDDERFSRQLQELSDPDSEQTPVDIAPGKIIENLRTYQEDAVSAILEGLMEPGSRGHVVMCCGSGKTLVAIRASDELVPDGVICVLAPTLALVSQLHREWRKHSRMPFGALGVSSDDELLGDDDVQVAVTTDEAKICDFLQGRSGRVVLFGTYASSDKLGAALMDSDLSADLIIADEAHRTAGIHNSLYTTMLYQSRFPAARRLFLTATPRMRTLSRNRDGERLISMDDSQVYGPRLYTYTFGRAIQEGWLSDYRVVISVVTDGDLYRGIHKAAPVLLEDKSWASAGKVAAAITLDRAINEHHMDRSIVYHNSISSSRLFTEDLQKVTRHEDLEVYHLDAMASRQEREAAIAALRDGSSRTVISNVRVLAEGVDVPDLDGIMFAEPKSSQVDVIQAMGRALRLSKKGDPAIILIPVYVTPDENGEAALSGSEYRHVWQVINAIRDHDSSLDAEFRWIRKNTYDPDAPRYEPGVLPDRIVIDGDTALDVGRLRESIITQVLDHNTTSWAQGVEQLKRYIDTRGDTMVPKRYVDEESLFPLGSWVSQIRTAYRWRQLDQDRVDLLNQLGFHWGERPQRWKRCLSRYLAIRKIVGHTDSYMRPIDAETWDWMMELRERHDQGRLSPLEVDELSENDIKYRVDRDPKLTSILKSLERHPERAPSSKVRKIIESLRIHLTTTEIRTLEGRHGISGLDSLDGLVDLKSPTWESELIDRKRWVDQVLSIGIFPPAISAVGRKGAAFTLESLIPSVNSIYANRIRQVVPQHATFTFDDLQLDLPLYINEVINAMYGTDEHGYLVTSDMRVHRYDAGKEVLTLQDLAYHKPASSMIDGFVVVLPRSATQDHLGDPSGLRSLPEIPERDHGVFVPEGSEEALGRDKVEELVAELCNRTKEAIMMAIDAWISEMVGIKLKVVVCETVDEASEVSQRQFRRKRIYADLSYMEKLVGDLWIIRNEVYVDTVKNYAHSVIREAMERLR